VSETTSPQISYTSWLYHNLWYGIPFRGQFGVDVPRSFNKAVLTAVFQRRVPYGLCTANWKWLGWKRV
jgi:hypothetical protein